MPHENEDPSKTGSTAENQEPKYVTADEFGTALNAAVTNHMKRFEAKYKSDLESALKPIVDKLSAPPPPPSDDAPEKKGKNTPEIAALQQQLEEFKRQARDAEERRAATERKSREDGAYSSLKAALSGVVRPEMLDVIAGYMFKVQGAVEVPEDGGEPVFKTTRSQFGVEEEVRLPIKDGVSSWAKSEAAKPWLPAPSTTSAPQTKKPGHPVQRLPENLNLENASDEQKLRAASEMEQQMRAALAAAGKSL